MESENKDTDYQNIKYQLQRNIEIMKVLNSHIRFRIILLLLIFHKLSLSELSRILERTKSTLTHHLKKLENLGLLRISRIDVRGSIEANFYELVPNFLQKFDIKQRELNLLKESEIKEILHLMLIRDQWLFITMTSLFEQSRLFYDGIDNSDPRLELNTTKEILDYYYKNKSKYNFWLLDKNEYKSYKNLINQFNTKLRTAINPKNRNETYLEKSYFVFHTLIPLNEIAQYESERKKYRKFFKILE